jgi:hypothetical protein
MEPNYDEEDLDIAIACHLAVGPGEEEDSEG